MTHLILNFLDLSDVHRRVHTPADVHHKVRPQRLRQTDGQSVFLEACDESAVFAACVDSDPVLPGEAVQLHLAAAHPVGEVRVRLPLHLLPVHVIVGTPGDTEEAVLPTLTGSPNTPSRRH